MSRTSTAMQEKKLSKTLRGHIVPHFLSFLRTFLGILNFYCIFILISWPLWCLDILFRTFLDILFLPPPLLSILSKILRGHIVPHFLRSLQISSYLFPSLPISFYGFLSLGTLFVNLLFLVYSSKILRGHIVPHFLRFLFFPSSY